MLKKTRSPWFYRLAFLSILCSVLLLVWVFSHLDWADFLASLTHLDIIVLLPAFGFIMLNICTRAWRWCWVSGSSPRLFIPFWQAVSIGYLGNLIYPARAGEILRMFAIHYFANLKLGHAISSAFLDRLFDILLLGVLVLILFNILGQSTTHSDLNAQLGMSAIGVMIFALTVLFVLLHFSAYFKRRCQAFEFRKKVLKKLQKLCLEGLDSLRALRSPARLLMVFALSALAFGLDSLTKWQVMQAFGWDLPFTASMLCVAFIMLGASIPSLPGNIGAYQVACVFALSFYGIAYAEALAFSIVMQLIEFSVIGVQGVFVVIYRGFDLKAVRQQKLG
jgi:uncharacterized protein (TIRG00374 family)